MSFRASGASRSESNEMIASGNHTLILRTLAWESVFPAAHKSRVALKVPQKMRIATPVTTVTGSQ